MKTFVQAEEARIRIPGTHKDQQKEVDALLSSLAIAPVSGKVYKISLQLPLTQNFTLFVYSCRSIIKFVK